MRAEEQTSRHLILAVITTVFSGVLSLITVVMAWEVWMIALMAAGWPVPYLPGDYQALQLWLEAE